MASISASGTASAAPTMASAISMLLAAGPTERRLRRLGAALIIVAMLPGASPTARLDVDVAGMRSAKGLIQVCLTADPDNFPNCVDDARASTKTVPARQHEMAFEGLPPGRYALAVIHDENGNAKLDTFAGIPREGFGFSRNPAIRFGPPKFNSARFEIDGPTRQQVRMKYML